MCSRNEQKEEEGSIAADSSRFTEDDSAVLHLSIAGLGENRSGPENGKNSIGAFGLYISVILNQAIKTGSYFWTDNFTAELL
jgi:hypothetical protein